MKDIDKPIQYNWTLGWEHVSNKPPIMNLLLKAILEKDINEIIKLEKQGASLKKCDKRTLQVIIFDVVDCYPIMKWLVDHGMSRIAKDIDALGNNGVNDIYCISPYGTEWGVAGRAYFCGAYDVFDLLCANGFSNLSFYDGDKWSDAALSILENKNEYLINILLSNGYILDDRNYENYVLNRSQIKRKSIGLDPWIWSGILEPKYESIPLIFGRKETIRRNDRIREDYEDRIRSYDEFVNEFGIDNYKKHVFESKKLMKETMDKLRVSYKL